MKSSIKGLIVILVIVMSFVVVQSVCAETHFVEGTITEISTQPNMIIVNGTEVYGVRFNFLSNKHDIDLSVNQWVIVKVYEYECSDGTTMFKACEITVPVVDQEDSDPILLRPCL
jgi:hypothetical protein